MLLNPYEFVHYIAAFNRRDAIDDARTVKNGEVWQWLCRTVPLFECPDKDIEEAYYFRWWVFRKHLYRTPQGWVITEFLPEVPWAGRFNTISCSALHHYREGRWLHDRAYLNDYTRFWFEGGGDPCRYSFPAADSLWAKYLVDGDARAVIDRLPDLVDNRRDWEANRRAPDGLFYQTADRDGMEFSLGGDGFRPTINSYLFGNAVALKNIAQMASRQDIAARFEDEATRLQDLVVSRLWDPQARFFKVLSDGPQPHLADARELAGYVPWCYNLPPQECSEAWAQLMDPEGFYARFGPTTAERRHPDFMASQPHECTWNGPSWPYATSQTLTAMINLLHDYRQDYVSSEDFLELMHNYAHSHRIETPDGAQVPWIDENLEPDTGEWLTRNLMRRPENIEKYGSMIDRGRDYNHSTFCDLVITGLVGLRPRADDLLDVEPLVPEGAWDYFCLDHVRYHGHLISILYDKTGEKYNRGAGLHLFVDNREVPAGFRLALP